MNLFDYYFTHLDMLIANANDYRVLVDTFSEVRVVLNCTGPFRFLGKDIVAACIAARSNYLDICGEPQFMEQSYYDNDDEARKNGCLILHACAFDSVPADLGCLFTMNQYGPDKCSSIESFLIINCPKGLAGHYTTYESAVYGVGDVKKLKKVRKEITAKYKPPPLQSVGPALHLKSSTYYYEPRVEKYAMPFKGADVSVVRGSQRSVSIREGKLVWPQYNAYVCLDSQYYAASSAVYGGVFATMASFSVGRSILLQFPKVFSDGVFSKAGPTAEQLEETSFDMYFFASGYNDETDPNPQVMAETGVDDSEIKLTNELEGKKKSKIKPSDLAPTVMGKAGCSVLFPGVSSNGSGTNGSGSAPPPALDKFIRTVVSGPEPGYIATPAILVTLALIVLEDRSSLPNGGVMTPSSCFYSYPRVFDKLNSAGIYFRVVNEVVSLSKEELEYQETDESAFNQPIAVVDATIMPSIVDDLAEAESKD